MYCRKAIDVGPPALKHPGWFLRNVVDRRVMDRLLDRITRFYDDLFVEVVYRAHHNSFEASFTDVFYNDFVDYIVKACGLKRRVSGDTCLRNRRFYTCMREGRSSSNISRSP